MNEEIIEKIMNLLILKAKQRRAISYSRIYSFFEKDTKDVEIWNTFEEACTRIATPDIAIYGALLYKKSTRLPSNGFYHSFFTNRYQEYMKVTDGERVSELNLTQAQMEKIAEIERNRVHQHAMQYT